MLKLSKILFYFSFIFFSYLSAWSQMDTAWVRVHNGLGNGYDEAKALAVDDSGNVYVTGRSLGSIGLDNFCTLKYNSWGDSLWDRSYNGLGNDIDVATSIAVDNSGNVYVTGYTWNGGSDDYTTIKYSALGDTLWVRNYNGPGNGVDQANALTVDNNGNVYITGTSRGFGGTARDYATIKYSAIGDTLWIRRYDGPAGGQDDASFAIALDDSGNVYVTGFSRGVGSARDFATIKYNSIGDTLWLRRYNGPGFGDDSAKALVVDSSGNIYVTGSSVGSGSGYDYTTIKYNSIGDTLWLRRFNGAGNGADLAQGLALDFQQNLYVTGYSWNGSSYDFLTVKYNSLGDTIWTKTYNGSGNGADVAQAVSVDKLLNLYLTGYSWNGSSYDYVTIKYIQTRAPVLDSIGPKTVAEGSNLTFRVHSSDPDGDSLILTALNLPANANFIDSGNGAGSFGFTPDFSQAGLPSVTFKTTDGVITDSEIVNINVTNLCLAKSGDLNGDGNILLPDIVLIVNFLFRGAPAPVPYCRGDVNASGTILLTDVIYLINFIFKSGPAPMESLECCL